MTALHVEKQLEKYTQTLAQELKTHGESILNQWLDEADHEIKTLTNELVNSALSAVASHLSGGNALNIFLEEGTNAQSAQELSSAITNLIEHSVTDYFNRKETSTHTQETVRSQFENTAFKQSNAQLSSHAAKALQKGKKNL